MPDTNPKFNTIHNTNRRDHQGIMPPDRGIEMSTVGIKEDSFTQGSSWSVPGEPSYDDQRESALRRWFDSFKRDPHRRVLPKYPVPGSVHDENGLGGRNSGFSVGGIEELESMRSSRDHSDHNYGPHYFDLHAANISTANTMLARELRGRHLQMIAIGGSIGTGLFVASGKSLNLGGPASLLIAYGFIGVMLYCTIQALGELAVTFPVAGSFSAYSTRFLDPAWGFAMGWNYALQWLVVLPLEIIAASITVGYWNSNMHRALFVTIFLITIVVINLFGVKGYGEAEFMFAIVKITAVIGFILLGIVINIGGFPNDGYIGSRYWTSPGAFHNGFKGLCSVFVSAAFAFTGTELVGLAAAEAVNPRKSLPTAIKQVFWRITLFYIVSLTLIGLLVPYNHPELLGAKSMADAGASPFVIAIESAGIDVLPGVMNSVILVAVLSVGNSAVFGSSRTLAALADQRQAPKILGYVDRRGRPLVAIGVASLVGLLGYLADLEQQSDVLNWLLAVSGLSSIFTWGSICLCHIRFRKAWAAKGRTLNQLAFRSQAGILGSYVGLIFNFVVLVAQFWTAAWPIPKMMPAHPDFDAGGASSSSLSLSVTNTDNTGGGAGDGAGGGFGITAIDGPPIYYPPEPTPQETVTGFFLQYLCVPIVAAFYLGHKLWFRTKVVKIEDMDLDTGRRDFNLPILVQQESDERKGWPLWKRGYKFFC